MTRRVCTGNAAAVMNHGVYIGVGGPRAVR